MNLVLKDWYVSEGGGISYLIYHHVVSTQKEAGALALKSGVDVGISYEEAYMGSMIENVNEGKVNISTMTGQSQDSDSEIPTGTV